MAGRAGKNAGGAVQLRDGMHQLFIVAAVVVVFWGALDHAPRADQHMILFQFQRYTGVVELFRETVSWPRAILKADVHLFRPLGNLFMALQWALFGYAFALYQAVGIALHALAVLLIYRVSVRRLGVAPWLALPSSLAFAFYPMSSEAVLWHTLNQMALWAVLALLGLDRYLAAPPTERAPLSAFALLVLAALVIDQGTVLIGIVLHAALLFAWRRWIADAPPATTRAARHNLLAAAFAFVAVVALNIGDLCRTGWSFADLAQPAAPGAEPLLPMPFTVLRFWLMPFLQPAFYAFTSGGRMGVAWSLAAKPVLLANLLDATLFIAATACLVWGLVRAGRSGRQPLRTWPTQPWIAPLIVALGFVGLFVLGRAASRGVSFALINGLHASYPFMVMFTLGMLGLAASLMAPLPPRWAKATTTLAVLALAVLAGLQAHSLLRTIERFTRFGAPDLAVYRAATTAYAAEPEAEVHRFTFAFREPCDINYRLPWFRDMTIAEAAFPRWYRPNSSRALECPVGGPERPVAIRTSKPGSTPARRLFDGMARDDSFFHVESLPVEIEMTLARPLRLSAYSFAVGEHAGGMPRGWRVWGISRSGASVLLDEQREVETWSPHQLRSFALRENGPFDTLRFEFLAGHAGGLLLYEIGLVTE